METAVRYSSSATADDERFLYVDVAGRSLQLSRITDRKNGIVEFESVGSPAKTPPFRTFEWSPVDESLVAVGQSSGEATLVKIAGPPSAPISFQARSQRACNAVALSTQYLLAAGLDKVRNDTCLNIWDLQQRLVPAGSPTTAQSKSYSEPLHKLAPSESITSVRFFHNDPQLLVAGVKGQFIRLYDLREPSSSGALSFSTRCVRNLAIDSIDENSFASCCPTDEPTICLWDRRMSARVVAAAPLANINAGYGPPEVSLELKKPVEDPGSIWSLRFSKTKRGHLGVLSSTGQVKVFDFEREYLTSNEKMERDNKWEPDWDAKQPQKVYLDRSQDIEYAHNTNITPSNERARAVSFDFTLSTTRSSEPEVMVLTGNGTFKVLCSKSIPEPTAYSSIDFFIKGRYSKRPPADHGVESEAPTWNGMAVDEIRRRSEARHRSSQTTQLTAPGETRYSSFAGQSWNSDLGFFETNAAFEDVLVLSSLHRRRCEAGYLFSPAKNIAIVSESRWLRSFWAWIERAAKISQSDRMVQDNLDLSYLGVHAIWMEDVPFKSRSTGPSSNKVSRHIEALARRLKISSRKGHSTEYASSRKLCQYVSGLSSTVEELETIVEKLVTQNKHTKAAALALFADERKLAHGVLRRKSASQNHRMLAMAIAGAMRRARDSASGSESDAEDDWSATIAALAEEMVDPYARAILAYVRTGDWREIVMEESLPLKYRIGIALRWLSDSALTTYISKVTKQAVVDGDIEGVILTGTGTNASVELMTNYIKRFGDLQTAVLALSMTVPRYIDDPTLLRQFEQWREVYRHQLNSWGLKYHRVRFDIGSQKFSVDLSRRRLVETAKPQIAMVCGYCSQNLAQFDSQANGEATTATRRTQKHPLASDKAAAIGTVCPKCGRHLPRCGVCDMWLGTPDPTHLSWYGQAQSGTTELSASMAGSVNTTIRPASISSPGPKLAADAAKDTQDTSEAKQDWEDMVRKFTVFCIKCSHGFHAHHARQWFGGYAGRDGHKVCPVSNCECVCDA